MKTLLAFLLFGMSSQIAFAQSAGPVYNFNFYNKEVPLPGANIPGAPVVTAPLTESPGKEVKSERQEYSARFFSHSILNPEASYLGVVGSYALGLRDEKTIKKREVFSINILLDSLWGIKVSSESFGLEPHYGDEYFSYNIVYGNFKSYRAGVNKLIPLGGGLALELGGYFEKGKFTFENGDLMKNVTINSGLANIGIDLFLGNVMVGISYQERFAANVDGQSALKIDEMYGTKVKNQSMLLANVGICL